MLTYIKEVLSYHILLFLLFFQVFQIYTSAQDKKYPPAIEKKIQEVENNLGLPGLWIQVEGISNKNTLKERMDFYHVKGVSIAVIKDYEIEWARGYGWADSAGQRPVTTATLFQAGSISKSLNGVGVLKLVQDGKLDLSADINNYLRTWKFPYDSLSKGKKISIANLLSHTAGLTIHGFPGYEAGAPVPTLSQVLDGVKPSNSAAVRSAFEPGIKYQYSGGGTTISQTIVEDISGKPYEVFMWEKVLKPMGMLNSFYTQPPAKEKQNLLATAYSYTGKAIKGNYHIYPEKAAAGLWTNPTDLARYIIETQLALRGKSSKVLSQEMTKLRLTPYVDSTAALGVFINKKGERTYFQHGGADEGFVAQYWGSMDGGSGVVVMSNTDNSPILSEIINSVATAYGWKGFYQPQIKKVIKVNDNILETYIGTYKVENNKFFIERENDSLIFNINGSKRKMYFTSDADFFLIETPKTEYSFTKDKQNKVDGVQKKKGSDVQKANKVL